MEELREETGVTTPENKSIMKQTDTGRK